MESEGFDCGTGGNFAIHDILFGDCLRDLAWEAKPDKSLAQCLPSEEKAWLGKSNKTAEAHRISGNTRFGKQQYMAALVYYNLAISAAEKGGEGDSALASAYMNRALTWVQLDHYDQALLDADRAISLAATPMQRKKFSIRKLNILVASKYPALYEQVDALAQEIRTQYKLTTADKSGLEILINYMDNRRLLKSLNTLNLEQGNNDKILKSVRIPLMMQKDRSFLQQWLECQESTFQYKTDRVEVRKSKCRVVKVSSKGIERMELVSVEKALICFLSRSQAMFFCSHCMRPLLSSVPCRGCDQLRFYCNDSCEAKAYGEYHQFECGPSNAKICQNLSLAGKFTLRFVCKVGGVRSFLALFQESVSKCSLDRQFEWDSQWLQASNDEHFWCATFCSWLMQVNMDMAFVSKDTLRTMVGNAHLIHSIATSRIGDEEDKGDFDESIKALTQFQTLFEVMFDQILQPVKYEPPHNCSLYDHQLVTEILEQCDNQNAEYWKDIHEKLRKHYESKVQTSQIIGFGWYPLQSILWKTNDARENASVVFRGNTLGVRASKDLKRDQTLFIRRNQFNLELADRILRDRFHLEQACEQMAAFASAKGSKTRDTLYLTSPQLAAIERCLNRSSEDKMDSILLEMLLNDAVVQHHLGEKNLDAACGVSQACLNRLNCGTEDELLRRLYVCCLLRHCEIEFEHFTERDVAIAESVAIAARCLLRCSEALHAIYEHVLPLAILELMHEARKGRIRLELIGSDWTAFDNLDILLKLEDMLVAGDMFSRQFGGGK